MAGSLGAHREATLWRTCNKFLLLLVAKPLQPLPLGVVPSSKLHSYRFSQGRLVTEGCLDPRE